MHCAKHSHLPTDQINCKACQDMSLDIIVNINGAEHETSLEQFMYDNDFEPEYRESVRAGLLKDGEFRDGGGAGIEWSIHLSSRWS